MSETERQLCISRIKEDHRDPEPVSWNLDLIKSILKSWQLYAFCIAWGYVQTVSCCSAEIIIDRISQSYKETTKC